MSGQEPQKAPKGAQHGDLDGIQTMAGSVTFVANAGVNITVEIEGSTAGDSSFNAYGAANVDNAPTNSGAVPATLGAPTQRNGKTYTTLTANGLPAWQASRKYATAITYSNGTTTVTKRATVAANDVPTSRGSNGTKTGVTWA